MKKITLANKELEAFLKNRKLFSMYIKNSIDYGNSIEELSKSKFTIRQSFLFSGTDEGLDFWWKVSEEFNQLQNKK